MRLGPVVLTPQGPREPDATESSMRSLEEVLADLDIIEINPDTGVIVTSKKLSHPLAADLDESPSVRELGASGTRWRKVLGGQEYNSELAGIAGLYTYDRMRRSDATVAQALKVAKTPVLEAEWWVDSADPSSDQANMQAEFVSKCLFEWMSVGWTQFITEALTMMDYGYAFHEKVFDFHMWKGHRRTIWRKFATRSPFDVQEWRYDRYGGPESVLFQDFNENSGRDVLIPMKKLLVFTYRKEEGNVEGRAALREMYKHWYYKENLYKIDAIQKERHGIGIPIIKLPPNFSTNDKTLANELGRNLRTNEWAHIVLPPRWEVEFAEVRGAQVDVLQSITHHDNKIIDSVLGAFATEDEKGDAEVMLDLFMKSSRYLADLIREVINKYAIPELIHYNWMGISDFPKLKVRHIGQITDLRTVSFTVRNLVGAKVITPDDELEDFMRDLNDLPRRDKETSRVTESPQAPGTPGARVGPPRQSTAANQRNMPGGSAGNDSSGEEHGK